MDVYRIVFYRITVFILTLPVPAIIWRNVNIFRLSLIFHVRPLRVCMSHGAPAVGIVLKDPGLIKVVLVSAKNSLGLNINKNMNSACWSYIIKNYLRIFLKHKIQLSEE